MRALHVIQRYPPAVGGSETWCQAVCRELSKRGCSIAVLTTNVYDESNLFRDPEPQDKQYSLGSLDYDEGVRVERFPRNLYRGIWARLAPPLLTRGRLHCVFNGPHSWGMYRQLFREVRRVDIIHLHTLPYPHNLFGLAAAKLFRKPVVITPHFHIGHKNYELVEWYALLKSCTAVITCTDYEKQYLARRGVAKSKITVSGDGVYPEQYRLDGLDCSKVMPQLRVGANCSARIYPS